MSANATCSGCPAAWTSGELCHCSECHRSFMSVGAFDRHRDAAGPHGRCLIPEKNGMRLRTLRGVVAYGRVGEGSPTSAGGVVGKTAGNQQQNARTGGS